MLHSRPRQDTDTNATHCGWCWERIEFKPQPNDPPADLYRHESEAPVPAWKHVRTNESRCTPLCDHDGCEASGTNVYGSRVWNGNRFVFRVRHFTCDAHKITDRMIVEYVR